MQVSTYAEIWRVIQKRHHVGVDADPTRLLPHVALEPSRWPELVRVLPKHRLAEI